MSELTMKQMLEAGSHFGHQTKKWNPKMNKYIFGSRNGIYIIDLQKSLKMFAKASKYVKDLTSQGDEILFVGTKKQAKEIIGDEAMRAEMPYVKQRWLGGMLTNFATINKSINRLKKLESMRADSSYDGMVKKEVLRLNKEETRLKKFFDGIKGMKKLPKAMFIVDPRKEKIAFLEAKKLNMKIVAVVDTNCDPTGIDYPIPGNDDAIRAIQLIVSNIADAAMEGKKISDEKKAVLEAIEAKNRAEQQLRKEAEKREAEKRAAEKKAIDKKVAEARKALAEKDKAKKVITKEPAKSTQDAKTTDSAKEKKVTQKTKSAKPVTTKPAKKTQSVDKKKDKETEKTKSKKK